MDDPLALALNISMCNFFFVLNITLNKYKQVICLILFISLLDSILFMVIL